MLKQTLQVPPQENGAIDGYTSELSRLLRPALSGERADEIIHEAQAHLYDRADAIAAEENLPQNEAETRAVAAFTPVVQFAREMAQSAFETGHSKAYRIVGRVAAAGFLFGLFALVRLVSTARYVSSVFWVLGIFMLFVAVCAFRARQAHTRQYAVWGVAVMLLTFLYTGFYFLDGSPTDYTWTQATRLMLQREYDFWHADALLREKQIARLQKGLQIYRESDLIVPNDFRATRGAGYIVPGTYLSHTSFQPYTRLPQTVPTLAEARVKWQVSGPDVLARVKQAYSRDLHYEEPLRITLQQRGFSKIAWWYAMVIAGFGGWLVTLDWLFAKMGRANFTKRRARRVKRA